MAMRGVGKQTRATYNAGETAIFLLFLIAQAVQYVLSSFRLIYGTSATRTRAFTYTLQIAAASAR